VKQSAQKFAMKQVSGGMLVQDADIRPLTEADLKIATTRQPTAEEMRALLFAWKVCKHVKSNAIVYAREGQDSGRGGWANVARGFLQDWRHESDLTFAGHGSRLLTPFSHFRTAWKRSPRLAQRPLFSRVAQCVTRK